MGSVVIWYNEPMKMLRDWNGESNDILLGVLEQFGVEASTILLQKYEAITLDSRIWNFSIKNGDKFDSYYLYAEDYVPDLEHVTREINQNLAEWTPEDKVKLVPVVTPTTWKESSPVQSSDFYTEPGQPSEFMKFAATSGHDFVFLAKVVTSS
jgi:hypothetical protein